METSKSLRTKGARIKPRSAQMIATPTAPSLTISSWVRSPKNIARAPIAAVTNKETNMTRTYITFRGFLSLLKSFEWGLCRVPSRALSTSVSGIFCNLKQEKFSEMNDSYLISVLYDTTLTGNVNPDCLFFVVICHYTIAFSNRWLRKDGF